MKLHTVHIRLVTLERLHDVSAAHIPNQRQFIAALQRTEFDQSNTFSPFHLQLLAHPRHKRVARLVGRQVDGHHISSMSVKALQQLARLHVPQCAGRVATSGQDLLVRVRKYAAAHVARVRPNGLLLAGNVLVQRRGHRVHGHLVVQATASDEVSGRRVRTGHHPGGGHRDGVLLVRRERIPDNQLAVLRRTDDVSFVRRPVRTQHLCLVALQHASGLDVQVGYHFETVSGSGHWKEETIIVR